MTSCIIYRSSLVKNDVDVTSFFNGNDVALNSGVFKHKMLIIGILDTKMKHVRTRILHSDDV